MKKLNLEILNEYGEMVRSYLLRYDETEGKRIRLVINDNIYAMDTNGKLVLTQDEMKTENPETKPKYYNPETNKIQNLFDEQTLIDVWEVYVDNYDVIKGNKGAYIHLVVEAQDQELAKDKAMLNEEFMSYIHDRQNFKREYLFVHKPMGNYVIGKVEYYSGDPIIRP